MFFDSKKIAGLILILAAAQFIFAVIFAETLDSTYNLYKPIIYLGTGSAAALFDSSLLLLGILGLVGAYFFFRVSKDKLFLLLLAITSITMGLVGIFTENSGQIHVFFVRTFMIFEIPTAIYAFRFQKSPLSYVSVALGLIILFGNIFFLGGAYVSQSLFLGLAPGPWQRLIVYPFLLWMLTFGAYLIGESNQKTLAK